MNELEKKNTNIIYLHIEFFFGKHGVLIIVLSIILK